jgi:hypothetical protein
MTTTFINQIGNNINGAKTLEEALEMANLNWTAKSAPVEYHGDLEGLLKAPAYKVIYKDTDKSCLGVVGANYGIIQNTEAFAIAEALIGGKVEFRRAGQVLGQTFIILQGEETYLLGDPVENYIIIRNSFDGSSRLQIAWVPVLSKNGNSYFLSTNQQRVFAIQHSAAWIKKYGKTFVETLMADGNQALESYAKAMLGIKYTPSQLTKVLDQFLPLKTDKDGNLKIKANESILEKRQYFANLLNSQDLAQYQGTIYQVYRALNELETHSFQSAKVIKPERNSYKKVKHLFTNKGLATEAIDYLEKVIAGRV